MLLCVNISVDISDAPAWIEALATVAAAGFAFTAWRQAKGLHQIESKRDRDRHDADERAAAEGVAVWADWDKDRRVWGARVRNPGPLPVYDVKVVFRHHDTGASMAEIAAYIVPPKVDGVLFEWPKDADANAAGLGQRNVNDTPIELTFSDTKGRTWHRDAKGVLWPVEQRNVGRLAATLPRLTASIRQQAQPAGDEA